MRTELLGQEKNIVKIKLEIDAEEFTKALNKAINDLSKQVNVAGFRKGKIPRNVLEMRFGRAALYEEALDKILPDEIKQIVEDYDLDLLDTPKLNLTEPIKEGQQINCELSFEVRPEIELPDIDNLEIEKVISKVDDDSVNQLEKRLKVQFAKVNPAEHQVQDENLVEVELSVRVLNDDGSEAQEQPKPNTTHERINLADQTVRQQVRDALINHSKDETVEAVFDVEAAHADKTLAGKKVKYIMKIEGVSEFELPEMNDEFYKLAFGENSGVTNYDQFREKLRSELLDEVNRTTDDDLHNRAVEMVVNLSKMEIPEDLIVRQRASMRRDDQKWAKDNGVNYEIAYGLDTKEGREGYEKLLQNRAETAVRNVLVIDAVAKKYDVHVESSDIEAEFDTQAKRYGISKAVIANYFNKNKNEFDRLIDEVRFNKIVDVMLSHMKIKDVETLSANNNNQPSQEQN